MDAKAVHKTIKINPLNILINPHYYPFKYKSIFLIYDGK